MWFEVVRISREIVLRRNRDLQAQRQALLQLARLSDDNGLRSLKERYPAVALTHTKRKATWTRSDDCGHEV